MHFKQLLIVFFGLLIVSCKPVNYSEYKVDDDLLVIAFGSCNKQFKTNKLWDDIAANNPHIWIWGGDNIYSDTEDMDKMKHDYDQQVNQEGYSEISDQTKILGTWDDHDYGLNDGGQEFKMKAESQQLFLDFMGVDKNDERRNRQGVYHSEIIKTRQGSVKIIVLDTRYFRSGLTASEIKGKRYQPNEYGLGTILGAEQWNWLENELNTSRSDFNIIVSSIQFLSNQHGFETWGNFPHEVDKLKTLMASSKAKRIMLLSGDRHISEFSRANVNGLNYPIIDFTSSGMTHSYSNFSSEENPFRVGEVISDKSFGLLKIDFKSKSVLMQMVGDGNKIQQELLQKY